MSADDFVALDSALGPMGETWEAGIPQGDELRVFVPFAVGTDGSEMNAALLLADSVTIPDPIDGVFFGGPALWMTAGMGLALKHAREYSLAQHEATRRDLLEKAASSDRGLESLRSMLSSALAFLEEWRRPLAEGVLRLTPIRSTVELAMNTAHLSADREGLLPDATGEYVSSSAADPWASLMYEIRDAWPRANVRFAQAEESRSRLIATDEYEWHYLCAALRSADPRERDLAKVDSRAAVGLAVAVASLSLPLQVSSKLALEVRSDSDEFEDWRSGLRSTIRRLPAEAIPGTAEFDAAASNVIREELGPRIRKIERSGWLRRLRESAPREIATLSVGAAGLLGLSQIVSMPPAAFAALPMAPAARLAVGALFDPSGHDESTVLLRLVRHQ